MLDSLRDFLDHGAWTHWPLPVSVTIFVVVCALGVAAFVPKSLFAPIAGALFGAIGGTVVTLVGATLGALISLYLGRRLGRERISGWLHKREALAVLDRRLSRNGLVPITILRMIPVIPSSVVSYGAAATGIRTGQFLLGTALGMLPMTLVQCAAGASVRSGLSTPVVVSVFVGCVSLALVMVAVRRRGGEPEPTGSPASASASAAGRGSAAGEASVVGEGSVAGKGSAVGEGSVAGEGTVVGEGTAAGEGTVSPQSSVGSRSSVGPQSSGVSRPSAASSSSVSSSSVASPSSAAASQSPVARQASGAPPSPVVPKAPDAAE
ncbi:TVP38/TMEM64 family protein [Embleya sp. NPDC050493]|uniref:TVP38/TMEM64 family protein n=1 Tax=Embleya sp. NPDC050493 TaxID=3363989 RepID=UPI0037B51695